MKSEKAVVTGFKFGMRFGLVYAVVAALLFFMAPPEFPRFGTGIPAVLGPFIFFLVIGSTLGYISFVIDEATSDLKKYIIELSNIKTPADFILVPFILMMIVLLAAVLLSLLRYEQNFTSNLSDPFLRLIGIPYIVTTVIFLLINKYIPKRK